MKVRLLALCLGSLFISFLLRPVFLWGDGKASSQTGPPKTALTTKIDQRLDKAAGSSAQIARVTTLSIPDVSKIYLKAKQTTDMLKDLFIQAMRQVNKRVKLLMSSFSDLTQQIQQFHYQTDAQVAFYQQDPSDKNLVIGLGLTFDAPGHGDLTAFKGCVVDVELDIVPDALQVPFQAIVKETLREFIFKGETTFNEATGQVTLKSSPVIEFLFKVAMLGKDAATGLVAPKNFGNEMILLMYRLAQTPNIKTVADMLDHVPGPIAPLLRAIPIGNTTLDAYISILWQEFESIFNYDFTVIDRTVLDVKDVNKVIKIMLAIILRVVTDSAQKNANRAQIKIEGTTRFIALLTRFKLYRMLKPTIMAILRPLGEDVLKPLGISLDDLLPPDSQFAVMPEDEKLLEETESILAQDPLFVMEVGELTTGEGNGQTATQEAVTHENSNDAQAEEQP